MMWRELFTHRVVYRKLAISALGVAYAGAMVHAAMTDHYWWFAFFLIGAAAVQVVLVFGHRWGLW